MEKGFSLRPATGRGAPRSVLADLVSETKKSSEERPRIKLSIIIVGWNTCEDLARCLQSIRQYPPSQTHEVIVVDNASTDDTADMIRKNWPHVTLLANAVNRGFAAANNQGLAKATGQYILLLNADTIVRAGALETMIRFMDDHGNVGICGPLLRNCDGTTQPSVRQFPDFRSALYRNTIFGSIGLFRRRYRRYMMCDFAYDRPCDVDQVMGAALMTRRSIVEEVGPLDERFFMYFEEVDFCYRVKHAGWRVVFIPQAQITHRGGASAEQTPVAANMMILTSLLAYLRKHRGTLPTVAFSCIFKPAVLLRHVVQVVANVPVYVFAALLRDRRTRRRLAMRIRTSALFVSRYSWQLLRV